MRSAALVVALSAGSHAFVAPSVRLGAPSLRRVAAASPTMLATPLRRAQRSRALAASIPAEADAPKPTLFETYTKVSSALTNLFPVWTVLFTGWALADPSAFAWLTTQYFTAGLAGTCAVGR